MTARLVVFASGAGSNLQAIIDACSSGTLQARVVGVVSNRPDAMALTRAGTAQIPQACLSLRQFQGQGRSRSDYDAALASLVVEMKPSLVVLAGWMHILSASFLDRVPCPIIILHPALPNAFPGLRAIQRAHEAARAGRIKHTGVMVHHVTEALDAGPVVTTCRVPILPTDSLEDLTVRVQASEHRVLVHAVQMLLASQRPARTRLPGSAGSGQSHDD